MQIIKTLTAYNGVNTTYSIKRLDDQPIQPNWKFKWSILELGSGTIISAADSNSVIVQWNENTLPNQWFTLKCDVDMGDSCVREIGIKIKVISDDVILTTDINERVSNQCTKQENSTVIENITGTGYYAKSTGSTKILWDITGGKFIKNKQLVSGPVQETPDNNGLSYIFVAWNNSGPPYRLTAQSSDNNNHLSNIAELNVDVLPTALKCDLVCPDSRYVGANDVDALYSIYDVLQLPYGNNLGDTIITTELYIGTLKDNMEPTSETNFEGVNWIGNKPLTFINAKRSELKNNTIQKAYTINIPKVYNSSDKTYYRFKYITTIKSSTNPDCFFLLDTIEKDFQILYCPQDINLGDIDISIQSCVGKINTGNIIINIPPCPNNIPYGKIRMEPGLFDPKPIGEPTKIPTYVPKPIGEPTDDYIFVPKPTGEPTKIPTYIPKPIGEPNKDNIFIPEPIGEPKTNLEYFPRPIGQPGIINVYLPKPIGQPNKDSVYLPKPIGQPIIKLEYMPKPIGQPIIKLEYMPKPIGKPRIVHIYLPKPIGQPNKDSIYLPKPIGQPTKYSIYNPKPIGEPAAPTGVIYVPSPIGKPKIKNVIYVPKPLKTPYTTTTFKKPDVSTGIDPKYTYYPKPLMQPYVVKGYFAKYPAVNVDLILKYNKYDYRYLIEYLLGNSFIDSAEYERLKESLYESGYIR